MFRDTNPGYAGVTPVFRDTPRMDKREFVQGLSQDCSSYCAMCKVLGTVHGTIGHVWSWKAQESPGERAIETLPSLVRKLADDVAASIHYVVMVIRQAFMVHKGLRAQPKGEGCKFWFHQNRKLPVLRTVYSRMGMVYSVVCRQYRCFHD